MAEAEASMCAVHTAECSCQLSAFLGLCSNQSAHHQLELLYVAVCGVGTIGVSGGSGKMSISSFRLAKATESIVYRSSFCWLTAVQVLVAVSIKKLKGACHFSDL